MLDSLYCCEQLKILFGFESIGGMILWVGPGHDVQFNEFCSQARGCVGTTEKSEESHCYCNNLDQQN